MLEIENRYEQFGKAIRRKYCDFDQYYDIATLLFPEEWQEETADRDIYNTYITNLYELQYLKEENHLYQKNITFITNLLQKAVSKEILPSVETQVEKLVKEQLPQLEKTAVHQLTEQLYLTIKKEAGTEELTSVLQQFFAGDEKVQKISKNVQEQLIHSMTKIAGNTYTQQMQKQEGNTYTQQMQKQEGNTYTQQIQKLQKQEISRYEHQRYLEREKEKIELRQAVPLAEQFLISNYENYLPDTSYVNKNNYFQSVRYLQNTNYQKLLNQMSYEPMEERYSSRQDIYQQNVDARWNVSYPAISIEHPTEQIAEHPTVLTLQKLFLEENRNSYQKLYQQERKLYHQDVTEHPMISTYYQDVSYHPMINTYQQDVSYHPTINTYQQDVSYHQNVDTSWNVSYPAISIEHPIEYLMEHATEQSVEHRTEYTAEHRTEHPIVLTLQELFLEKNRNSYQELYHQERKLYQQERKLYHQDVTEHPMISTYHQDVINHPTINTYQQDVSYHPTINTYQQDVSYHQNVDTSWNVSYPAISIEHPIEYLMEHAAEQSVEHRTEYTAEHVTEQPTVLTLQKLFLEENRNSYQKLFLEENRNSYQKLFLEENRNSYQKLFHQERNTYHQDVINHSMINTNQQDVSYHPTINTYQQNVAYYQNVEAGRNVSYPAISIEHPIEHAAEQSVEHRIEYPAEHVTEQPTVLTLQKLFLEENRNSYQKLYHQERNTYHQDVIDHPMINTYQQNVAYYQTVEAGRNVSYPAISIEHPAEHLIEHPIERPTEHVTEHPAVLTLQKLFLEENRNSYQKLYKQELFLEENRNSYQKLQLRNVNFLQQDVVRTETVVKNSSSMQRQQDVALVYEQPKEVMQEEQNHTKELIQIKEEVRQDMDFIRETRNVVEQFHEEYEKWKTIQAAPAETTVDAANQGRALIQQEITRSLQKQVDASLNQITGQVYRRLEEKLKSERDRRGLM